MGEGKGALLRRSGKARRPHTLNRPSRRWQILFAFSILFHIIHPIKDNTDGLTSFSQPAQVLDNKSGSTVALTRLPLHYRGPWLLLLPLRRYNIELLVVDRPSPGRFRLSTIKVLLAAYKDCGEQRQWSAWIEVIGVSARRQWSAFQRCGSLDSQAKHCAEPGPTRLDPQRTQSCGPLQPLHDWWLTDPELEFGRGAPRG